MAVTIEEIKQAAFLARINTSAEEAKEFTRQLNDILKYADRIKELDTKDASPLYHILPVYNVFRQDEIIAGPDRNELMSNAPEAQDGYYKVPRIL